MSDELSDELIDIMYKRFPNTKPNWDYYFKKMNDLHKKNQLNWININKLKLEMMLRNPANAIKHILKSRKFYLLLLIIGFFFFIFSLNNNYYLLFEIKHKK